MRVWKWSCVFVAIIGCDFRDRGERNPADGSSFLRPRLSGPGTIELRSPALPDATITVVDNGETITLTSPAEDVEALAEGLEGLVDVFPCFADFDDLGLLDALCVQLANDAEIVLDVTAVPGTEGDTVTWSELDRFDAGCTATDAVDTIQCTVSGSVSLSPLATFVTPEPEPEPEPEPVLPPPDLVQVGPISFNRGCVGLCGGSETPLRRLNLSAFSIERTEVRVSDYRACVEDGGCTPIEFGDSGEENEGPGSSDCNYNADPPREGHPINCVTFEQAEAFCSWRGLRLPTEAEWEAAARGDDDDRYPWGAEEPTCELANLVSIEDGGACVGGTLPVDALPDGASPFGALNMGGNVGEWVADWFDANYYDIAPTDDPPGPAEPTNNRISRGGEWDRIPSFSSVWSRTPQFPQAARETLGFRCARSGN